MINNVCMISMFYDVPECQLLGVHRQTKTIFGTQESTVYRPHNDTSIVIKLDSLYQPHYSVLAVTVD